MSIGLIIIVALVVGLIFYVRYEFKHAWELPPDLDTEDFFSDSLEKRQRAHERLKQWEDEKKGQTLAK